MTMRQWYRMVLVFLLLLVTAAAIETGRWPIAVLPIGFGIAVWRAELPPWDQVWHRLRRIRDTGEKP